MNIYTCRGSILILCMLLFLPLSAFAIPAIEPTDKMLSWLGEMLEEAGSRINGYVESGARSSLEDFEEGTADLDYDYTKYRFSFEQTPSHGFSYDISAALNFRDYDDQDSLDNTASVFRGGFDWLFFEHDGNSLQLNLDLLSADKEFDNDPAADYNRLKAAPTLIFRSAHEYTLKLSAGADRYVFEDNPAADRFKAFTRLEGYGYLMDRKLRFNASAAISSIRQEQADAEQVQRNYRAGFDWKLNTGSFSKLMLRTGWGNRDTWDNIDTDAIYDLEYFNISLKSEHPIHSRINTWFKLWSENRDYLNAVYDSDNFAISNGWRVEVGRDTLIRRYLNISVEYKRKNYDSIDDSYSKTRWESRFNARCPKRWKLSTGFEFNHYRYDGTTASKLRSYLIGSGEWLLQEGALALTADLKLRNSRSSDDETTNTSSIRTGFRYRF